MTAAVAAIRWDGVWAVNTASARVPQPRAPQHDGLGVPTAAKGIDLDTCQSRPER